MQLVNYDGRLDCSSSVRDNFVSSLVKFLFVLLVDIELFGRWFVPIKGNVQLAKSSNGRHSWSKEHKRYDQPAMKNIRKANNSRRDINCHWRAPPSSGVALPCRVFAIEKICNDKICSNVTNLFVKENDSLEWHEYALTTFTYQPLHEWWLAYLSQKLEM